MTPASAITVTLDALAAPTVDNLAIAAGNATFVAPNFASGDGADRDIVPTPAVPLNLARLYLTPVWDNGLIVSAAGAPKRSAD